MMRAFILCSILLSGATSAAGESTADRARALFEKGNYAEAAALARQVFAKKPHGRAADGLRVLLCQAKWDGKDVGEPAKPDPGSQPLTVEGDVKRPEKIAGPNPEFSMVTSRTLQEGEVVVIARINTDGCVVESRIGRSLNEFADRDVLNAIRYWVFRPGLLDGKPADVHYTLTVNVTFDWPARARKPEP